MASSACGRVGLLRERGQKLDFLGAEAARFAAHLGQPAHLAGGDALSDLQRGQRVLAPLLHVGEGAQQVRVDRRVRLRVVAVAALAGAGIAAAGSALQLLAVLDGVRLLDDYQRLLGAQVEHGRERGATHLAWPLCSVDVSATTPEATVNQQPKNFPTN